MNFGQATLGGEVSVRTAYSFMALETFDRSRFTRSEFVTGPHSIPSIPIGLTIFPSTPKADV